MSLGHSVSLFKPDSLVTCPSVAASKTRISYRQEDNAVDNVVCRLCAHKKYFWWLAISFLSVSQLIRGNKHYVVFLWTLATESRTIRRGFLADVIVEIFCDIGSSGESHIVVTHTVSPSCLPLLNTVGGRHLQSRTR